MDSFYFAVRRVTPLDNYILQLVFEDGKTGYYPMLPLIMQEDGGDATFVPLKDTNLFNQAHIDEETVGWTENISIAAEELYSYCLSETEYQNFLAHNSY